MAPCLHARQHGAYGLPAALVRGAVSEQTGDYVLVERDDVVKALAAFIAEYIGALSAEGDRSQRAHMERADHVASCRAWCCPPQVACWLPRAALLQ